MEINDQNFQTEVLQSQSPVLVDFFASWCGPCKMQAPIIEELAKEYEGKVKVVAMDVDHSPQVSSQYQVMSIPTLVFIKGGKEVARLMGLQQKPAIKAKLDSLV